MATGKFPNPKKVTFDPTNVKASGSIFPPKVSSMVELVTVTLPDGKKQVWKVTCDGPFSGPLTARKAELVTKR